MQVSLPRVSNGSPANFLTSPAAARMLRARARAPVGFGSYPDEPCYDPNRSSWLPYWWPNSNEAACNATAATKAAACLVFPYNNYCMGLVVGGVKAVVDAADAAVNPAPVAPPIPKCVGWYTYNPVSESCEFDPSSPTLLITAGLAVFGLFLLKK